MPYPFQGLPPAVSVSAAILVAQQIILSREYVEGAHPIAMEARRPRAPEKAHDR